MITRDTLYKVIPSFVAGAIVTTFILSSTKQEQTPDSSPQEASSKQKKSRVVSSSQNPSDKTLERFFADVPVDQYQALIDQSLESGDDSYQLALRKILLAEWAKQDPTAAIEFAQTSENHELLFLALEQFGKSNGAAALDWLKSNSDNPQISSYHSASVFSGIAKSDPSLAMNLLEQLPEDSQKEELLPIIVEEWAKKDPKAVFAWMGTREVDAGFYKIYENAMYSYLKASPREAVSIIEALEESPLKASLSSQYATTVAKENPREALDWAKNLEDKASRKNALDGALSAWASQAPEDAFAYVSALSNEPAKDSLIQQVSVQFAHANPEKFASQLEKIPSDTQGFASGHIARSWFSKNPTAAQQWLDGLSTGPAREAAAKVAIRHYTSRTPARAFEIASNVPQRDRYTLAQQVITSWSKTDAPAAADAIEKASHLSPSEVSALLEITNNSPLDIALPQN